MLRNMVALHRDGHEPTRRTRTETRIPPLWRLIMRLDRWAVAAVGRLEITGDIPPDLRGRPILLAPNHIGVWDPMVLISACDRVGLAPQFLLAAGIIDTPVVGHALRASGHIRVDRGKANVVEAFGRAVDALRSANRPLLVYPEGRISRDPGLWPERGKTGVARIALAAGVPVVPISQWGAHEAAWWGSERVDGWADLKPILLSWLRAVRRRPVFRVHFGDPVDLSDLSANRPGDAVRAHQRIMRAITAGLVPLRRDEPDAPHYHDPTRPTDGHSPWRP